MAGLWRHLHGCGYLTNYTLFSQGATGSSLASDANPYTMGVEFSVSTACTLTAIWFYSASGAAVLPGTIALYAVSGTSLVHSEPATWSGAAGSGWVSASFSSPPALSTSANYKACVFQGASSNWYSATAHYWDSGAGSGGITSGPLTAPNNAGTDVGQDSFSNEGALSYPDGSFNAGNYWVDPQVTTASAPSTGSAYVAFMGSS